MVYTIDEIQRIITPIAVRNKLKAVYLFGSYARGTANERSDIDLLIDTTGSEFDTLFRLGVLYEEISDAFSKEIDLVTVSSLEQPAIRNSEYDFRESIMKERKNLYAAA